MSLVFTHAVRRGFCDRNPAREIGAAREKKRDRYITDDELEAVRAAVLASADYKTSSARSILCLIDLAYQTAQRIGDLLALNWQNVSDDGISFHPSKTVNSSGVRLLIEMTPDLKETLDRARGGKITAIGPALTDLKRQRGAAAAQSLAGHTTESMTAHYTKSREVERVQPVPLTRLS
ncbi:integrase [Burkholderia gladioli]|nr:integrase [Burkholderia gladioli]